MRELMIVLTLAVITLWAVSANPNQAIRARVRRPSESSARQYLREFQR